MTGEEMERAIQFLLEHHAKVSAAQDRNTANIAALTRTVVELAESVSRLEVQADETRDAIDKLILSNEVTRDLTNQVARLAVATSQRVSALEESRS